MMANTMVQPLAVSGCRRLFLRGFAPNRDMLDKAGWTHARRVCFNVEILVRYADSHTGRDLLEDVVDYNVMRDTVIAHLSDSFERICENACRSLLLAPSIAAALVEMSTVGLQTNLREGNSFVVYRAT